MGEAVGDVALAVLTPLITAVAAALGLWIAERRKDRDEVQRRLKAIGEETAQLNYLKSWLKTHQLALGAGSNIDAVRAEVCEELMRSRVRLGRALEDRVEPDSPSPLLRAWRNAALIPLGRPASRAIRWCYWFCVLLGGLMMMLAFATDYSEIEGYGFGMNIFVALFFFLPFGAVALGLRAWARVLERHGAPTPDPVPTALPQVRAQFPTTDVHSGVSRRPPPPPATPAGTLP